MNDLISRQAVKDWLLKWEGYIDKDTIARMQCRVIDIRPAEVEPVRHGRWVDHCGDAFCSECGYVLKDYYTNYCPNCGARMEDEK